jgi:hypothetical protein
MPTVVTSETIAAGATVEIGVENQDGTAIVPADITWALDPALTGVTVAPNADGVGFDFSAAAGTADQTGPATATYTPNGVTGAFTITVTAGAITVTALQFVTLP